MKDNFLNKKRKLVLPVFLLLFFFLSFNLVSAAVDTDRIDDTFQINDVVDYSKPCRDNGTYCGPTTNCNFTVKEPNNFKRISDAVGTFENGEVNISINFDKLGIWTVELMCCDPGVNRCGSETFYAEVTGSGYNNSLGFYLVILLISSLIIILGIWKEDAPIAILGSFGLYFLSIYSFINGIAGVRDVVYTRAFSIIILAVAMYISIKASYELITEAE